MSSTRRRPRARLLALTRLATAAALYLVASASAADWAQYHGPNGDGSSPEAIRTNWSANPPQILWRKPIHAGWSSPAIAGDRIYTQVRRANTQNAQREFVVALNTSDGQEIWATDVDSAIYTDGSGYTDQMDGPRSTPTIEGDRVYVLTSYLHLYCLRADNGAVIWHRDFMQELGSQIIPWENAASPLLVGDLIFLNSNSPTRALMAVRKSDGGTAFASQSDGLTHATPIYATIANTPQVIFLTRQGLVAITPEAGAVLWRLNFAPSSTSTASSPAVSGQYVHGSAAYGSGTWVARVTSNGSTFTATQAARQQGVNYQLHWSTPVEHNGFLYCNPSPSPSQARLSCFDPAAGTNRWTRAQVGTGNISYGSIIKAKDTLIVLTESGELVLVQPNPAAYTEIAKFQTLPAYCWNRPTLSNGRLYIRNSATASEIMALDLSLPTTIPTFGMGAELTPDRARLKLTLRPTTGAFDPSDTANIEILTATDPSSIWSILPQTFTIVDGALITEISLTTDPTRYFHAREKTN